MNLVVGTAGHIDHGKTSLVRSLTGLDLDRTPEERARGITIELGFARFDLPDGRHVAFVDVPGHERLVRTMIAGATGLDAVLLCVSAVDGVMPQTREHVHILDTLGLADGLLVLTMADLVDDELLEMAQDDAASAVAGTFLDGKPVLPFSSVTGFGRDALIAAIGRLTGRQRSVSAGFRLPIDRVFLRPGFGVVVTGTAAAGTFAEGDVLRIEPGGRAARVRGLEVHGRNATTAVAGQRIALNLAGVDVESIVRGDVVAGGPVAVSAVVDLWYRHQAQEPLPNGAPVRWLSGTAEALGHLHLAAEGEEFECGATVPAQVRLDSPVAIWPGDRFVVRRTSPLETLGGGVVVDPWAPRLRQRGRVAHGEAIERLFKGDRLVWLQRAGPEGLSLVERSARQLDDLGVVLGDCVLAPTIAEALVEQLLLSLAEFHADNPLARGAGRREIRSGVALQVTDRVWDGVAALACEQGHVVADGAVLRLATFAVRLTPAQREAQSTVIRAFEAAGPTGLDAGELARAFPGLDTTAHVRLLEHEGQIEAVAGLGWATLPALNRVRQQVRTWFTDHDTLTPGDFKELTGLARKGAIPLLEWLDRQRLTRRNGDTRVPGSAVRPTATPAKDD